MSLQCILISKLFAEVGKPSEMKENKKAPASLVFAVNGERFELCSVDPSTTLLQFLRTQTPFKSVKLGCGEGQSESLS